MAECLVTEPLFVFLAQGVARHAMLVRASSRHALMIYIRAPTIADARTRAVTHAMETGWLLIDIMQGKVIEGDLTRIEDDTHRATAEDAMQNGQAMIVYADEIPPDA